MGFEQAARMEKCSGSPALAPCGMQQQQFRQAAGALLEGGQVERALAARAGRRAPEGRCGRPGAGIDASRRCRAHRRDRTPRHAPPRKLLNHSAVWSPAATSSTAARDAHFGQRAGQAMGDGGALQPLLQRHDGEGLGPGDCRRRRAWRPAAACTICCIRFIITRGWRAISASKPPGRCAAIRCRAAPPAGRNVRWLPA